MCVKTSARVIPTLSFLKTLGPHLFIHMENMIQIVSRTVFLKVLSCSRYNINNPIFTKHPTNKSSSVSSSFLLRQHLLKTSRRRKMWMNHLFAHRKKSRRNRAPTRGHVANLIGMKTVTPRSIAYVCVQVSFPLTYHLTLLTVNCSQLRFALSNASAWHEIDACFNYINFYNNIVDFFEMTPGPAAQKRTQELLEWWSR